MRNIKELRKKKKESQSTLASVVGVSLRTIQNYESGDVNIPLNNLKKIAQHYDVPVSYLFKENDISLEKNDGEYSISFDVDIEKSDKNSFPTKSGNLIKELSNGKYLLTVPMIPHKAYATYISEFMDADYVSDLTKVSFVVDRVPRGVYRGFEIKNDSMNDATLERGPSRDAILQGDIVLGRELGRQHWKSPLRTNDFPFWIIVTKHNIICKEIINHDVEKGIITCHSLNDSPEFQDFDLKLDDCLQLFNIVKKQI